MRVKLLATFIVVLSLGLTGYFIGLFDFSSGPANLGDALIAAKGDASQILSDTRRLGGRHPDFIPYDIFQILGSDSLKNEFVSQAVPLLVVGKYGDYWAMGTLPTFIQRPQTDTQIKLSDGTWCDSLSQMVLGSQVARERGLGLNSKVPIVLWTGEGRGEPSKQFVFTVSGILKRTGTAWDRGVYIDLTQAQSLLPMSHQKNNNIWDSRAINFILIYLKGGGYPALKDFFSRESYGQAIPIGTEKNEK